MYCNMCGSQLPAGQTACPRCGMATPYNTIPSPELARESSSPQESVLPSYDLGPIMEFGPDSTNIYTQQRLQSNPYPADAPTAPPLTLIHAAQMSTRSGLITAMTTSMRRTFLSRGMIILLVAVAVSVIASGIGFIYYAAIAQPAHLHAQSVATAQALVKVQARASATAYTDSPQGIFALATHESPLVNDSLANNNFGFWTLLNRSDGGCTFSKNAFHIHVSAYDHSFYCTSIGDYTDFAFQVQMTQLKGSAGGIMFHALGPRLQTYLFAITKDGGYLLAVIQNETSSILTSNHSSAIKAGLNQSNLLTVIMRGSKIYLYANKQFLTMVNDNTFAEGYFSLYAATDFYTNSADVAFTDEDIWE